MKFHGAFRVSAALPRLLCGRHRVTDEAAEADAKEIDGNMKRVGWGGVR